MATQRNPAGPDFVSGVPVDDLAEGRMLAGHVGEEPALLVRRGDDFYAIGATCTHYGGPLAEGLLVGHRVRCPWHHAQFDVRTGDAAAAPALNPLPCWSVQRRGTRLVVGARRTPAAPAPPRHSPASVV